MQSQSDGDTITALARHASHSSVSELLSTGEGLRELLSTGEELRELGGLAASCDRGTNPRTSRRTASSRGMPGAGTYADCAGCQVLEKWIVIDVRVLIGPPGPSLSIVWVMSDL